MRVGSNNGDDDDDKEHEFYIGGNAALMAQFFAAQNVNVILGTSKINFL
jgi:hypothetical protein